MAQNIRRIQRELREIQDNPPGNCSCGPLGDNLYQWGACIIGPKGTPYEGGFYKLTIDFPIEYPFHPPVIRFDTKIYHPNITPDGGIQLDVLKSAWTPVLTISVLLSGICGILEHPQYEGAVNVEASQLFNDNPDGYYKKCQEYVSQYARE